MCQYMNQVLLWILKRLSGYIFLDSDHRERIVNEFFPKASHQMVILSTDTEIDREYFQDLIPYVSKAYCLEFDEKENSTKVVPGFFWTDTREPGGD